MYVRTSKTNMCLQHTCASKFDSRNDWNRFKSIPIDSNQFESIGCKNFMDRNRMHRRETFLTLSFVRSFVRPFAVFVDVKKFSTTWKFFKKLDRADAINFHQKIVKIGAILAIFEPFEVRKFRTPFFGEFGRSSQDLGESDYDSPKSWDDWLNSPKNGMCIIGDWNTWNLLFTAQGMSCSEHKECPA